MKIILTNIISAENDTKCKFIKNGAIVIVDGKIYDKGEDFKILKKYQDKKYQLIDRSKYLCMPSFFDMHFHWVQDDVRLMPKDSLLEWLSKYTWPYEAKFQSKKYSSSKAKIFAQELIRCGTLGGACYSSIHTHTVDDAQKNFTGDFIIGNVLMTMNSPKYLIQSEADAIKSVEKLSRKYKNRYALTPRFAPTTSPDVMKKTAKIAKSNKSFIQTHLSETPNEIEYVLSLYKEIKGFEKTKTYTEIYEKCHILSKKTIMGHGIYLSDSELKIIKKSKTAICHCPTSNAPVEQLGLGSGLFDFNRTNKFKVKWALGSDIGGGPYLSMFDVMRSFVEQNKKQKIKNVSFVMALYRATLAGAEILDIDKKCGSLKKNKLANMIFVKMPKTKSSDPEKLLSEIIMSKKNKRAEYDKLISETIYHGETIYSSISSKTGQ